MSTNLQSIVSTGMFPAGSSHDASYWVAASCTDPAYVDAVMRVGLRSREDMIEEMEQCVDQRTGQLHQAVNVIQDLIRKLEDETIRLEQTGSNLAKVHGTLSDVLHE